MNYLLKKTTTAFLLVCALVTAASGQDSRAARGAKAKAAEAEDAVERLLDRYMLAQGGVELFKLRTRVVRGRVEMSESPVPGTFEQYEKVPHMSIMVINLLGGQFLTGANGDRRWMQTPWGETRTVASVGSADLLRQAASGKGFKWRNAFSSAAL